MVPMVPVESTQRMSSRLLKECFGFRSLAEDGLTLPLIESGFGFLKRADGSFVSIIIIHVVDCYELCKYTILFAVSQHCFFFSNIKTKKKRYRHFKTM
jgi:hypothetical protein